MKIESKRKVEIIDYLRGFAALYVVIHHFLGFTELKGLMPEVIHFPFRFGQEVVMLFFIMSGFVIYTANQKTEEINFKQYFISYALYCVHYLVILLKLPFIANIYLLCFVKLVLIFMVSYLFELALQPLFYRLIKRDVQTNLNVSNG